MKRLVIQTIASLLEWAVNNYGPAIAIEVAHF